MYKSSSFDIHPSINWISVCVCVCVCFQGTRGIPGLPGLIGREGPKVSLFVI